MSTLDYQDEKGTLSSWPPTQDQKLGVLVRRFREKNGTFAEACKHHMALLWVLQLRTQCGLRGAKLSELFGASCLKAFVGQTSLNNPTLLGISDSDDGDNELAAVSQFRSP